jgi:flagellar protein FliL
MAVKGKIEDEPEGEDAEGEGKGEGKGKGKKPKVRVPAGPMTLVIVGAIALFVAVLGAQVAAPLLTKAIAGDPNAPAEEASAEDEEQLALAEELEEPVAEEESDEAREPAIYVPLDPPFVVSFNDEAGDTRFLQLTLQAMARDEHTIEAVKTHAPAIRNAFLFLISGYKVEDLSTLEGKEKLRAAMLASANEIMEKNTGELGIEELYFTSLVIQ